MLSLIFHLPFLKPRTSTKLGTFIKVAGDYCAYEQMVLFNYLLVTEGIGLNNVNF